MRKILTIWKKELKDTIRDKRTLIFMIIMPIVLMPLIVIGSTKLQESETKKQKEDIVQLVVAGGEYAPDLTNFLNKQDKIDIVITEQNLPSAIDDGTVDGELVIPSDYADKINKLETVNLIFKNKSTKLNSQASLAKVQVAVNFYNQSILQKRFAEQKINPNVLNSINIQQQDIATKQEVGGFILGFILPIFLVMFTIVGGMYTAIDISSGEKERKTLEALLLTPATRFEIVTGKFLTVATTAIITVVLSLTSFYFAFTKFPMQGGEMQIQISTGMILLMLGVGVLLSVMFSALLLTLCIFAKSFKEAQNYLSPIYILAILPITIINILPNFQPPDLLFAFPAVNATLLFKEMLVGNYIASHIIITIGSLIVFAFLAIWLATRIYSKESVLFRD